MNDKFTELPQYADEERLRAAVFDASRQAVQDMRESDSACNASKAATSAICSIGVVVAVGTIVLLSVDLYAMMCPEAFRLNGISYQQVTTLPWTLAWLASAIIGLVVLLVTWWNNSNS